MPDRAHAERVAEVRERLNRDGITATAWAKANGEDRWLVLKVLSGARRCRSGASHRIAVKLGIKDGATGAAR